MASSSLLILVWLLLLLLLLILFIIPFLMAVGVNFWLLFCVDDSSVGVVGVRRIRFMESKMEDLLCWRRLSFSNSSDVAVLVDVPRIVSMD